MRKRIMLLALAALCFAAPASAQQLFDFLGHANIPGSVGGTLGMNSVIWDPAPSTTPIPLDFANYEYTLVVSGLVLDVDGFSQAYSGGTITIFEDAGTAADFAVAGSFTDGTAILVGTFTDLSRIVFPTGIGNATGNVDWTGGTRLNDIAPEDQTAWPFLVVINVAMAETGYDEMWDGKMDAMIVADEAVSWGAVKAMLR